MAEQVKRAERGAARAKIITWGNEFFEEHKRLPTWTEALAGTGVPAMTLAGTWKQWRAEKETAMESDHVVPAPPVVPVPVPAVIGEAWSVAVADINAAALREIEADRLATRRELDRLKRALAEKDEMVDNLTTAGDEAQEERELEQAAASALLATATTVIEARDQEFAKIQQELAVRSSELKGLSATAEERRVQLQKVEADLADVKIANTRLTDAFDSAREAQAQAVQALVDKELKLESLTLKLAQVEADQGEAKIANTRLTDALNLLRESQAQAAQTLVDKELKLESLTSKLVQVQTDLAIATTSAAERRDQVLVADARADRERERGELAATEARKRVTDLERELAEQKEALAASSARVEDLNAELSRARASLD